MADVKKVRAPRFKDNDIIHFGKDKEGVNYGPDNNPRRTGTKSGDMFAKYRDGMTVAEAKAAGIRAVDVRWDVNAEHITIQPGAVAPAPAEAA